MIVLTQFVELTPATASWVVFARRVSLKTSDELTLENFPKIDSFLSDFAARGKRTEEMTDRLRAVGEEADPGSGGRSLPGRGSTSASVPTSGLPAFVLVTLVDDRDGIAIPDLRPTTSRQGACGAASPACRAQ